MWHPDVALFEIESLRGEPVGSFYLDAYARPKKRSGAWMDDASAASASPAGTALPVAYLVCNFLPPRRRKAARC